MLGVGDALHNRVDTLRSREVCGQYLDIVVSRRQFVEPVDASGNDDLRYAGLAEQLHHRLTDPARRTGDQRRCERVRTCHRRQCVAAAMPPDALRRAWARLNAASASALSSLRRMA